MFNKILHPCNRKETRSEACRVVVRNVGKRMARIDGANMTAAILNSIHSENIARPRVRLATTY